MRRVVVIDGVVVPAERARISVFDRGFLYGDSVFEVLRTYRGVASFAREHVERLARASAALEIPLGESTDVLASEVDAILRAAALGPEEEAVVRIVVSRGEGAGIEIPDETTTTRVVTVEPLELDDARLEHGLTALLVPRAAAPVPGAKTGSYLGNVLARREARRRGADEAVFLEGCALIEGAGANVFARRGDALYSASDDLGVLPGITRAHVGELAKDEGLAMIWDAPKLGEAWDEVFLTSSVRGVVPVHTLRHGHDTVFSAAQAPVCLRLRRRFHALGLARAAEHSK